MLTLRKHLREGVDAVGRGEGEEEVRSALGVAALLALPALHWHRAQMEQAVEDSLGAAAAPGGAPGGAAPPLARSTSGPGGAAERAWRPREVLWDKLWHERFGAEFGRCPAWGECALQWKERCVQALLLAMASGRLEALPQPRRRDLRALLAEAVVSADFSALRTLDNLALHRLLLSCPLLQRLNLDGTQVSDAGLRPLQHCCPRLCWIRLSSTHVTPDGVHDLLGWRPHLSVVI